MKKIFILVFILSGCSSAPSNTVLSKSYINDTETTDKAEKIKKSLTLGANQLVAGYSAEVMLYTEPLITAEEREKGAMNMDSEEKTKKEIEKSKSVFTKDKTCFLFTVHTYSINRSQFINWVSKLKDSDGKLHKIKFSNVTGVKSVPTPYKDINGRDWHNSSVGCTDTKIKLEKTFEVYLIPQIKNNQDQDETTVLKWTIN